MTRLDKALNTNPIHNFLDECERTNLILLDMNGTTDNIET